jgi:acyl-CoA hydrolase
MGQCPAGRLDGSRFSGTGGQLAFLRGASEGRGDEACRWRSPACSAAGMWFFEEE